MKTNYSETLVSHVQSGLYHHLNTFSKTHSTAGRVIGAPVAVLDVGLDTVKSPLEAIETFALVVINLLGAKFLKNCSVKHSLWATRECMIKTCAIAIDVLLAAIKLVFQLYVIMSNPATANSINFSSGAHKWKNPHASDD